MFIAQMSIYTLKSIFRFKMRNAQSIHCLSKCQIFFFYNYYIITKVCFTSNKILTNLFNNAIDQLNYEKRSNLNIEKFKNIEKFFKAK